MHWLMLNTVGLDLCLLCLLGCWPSKPNVMHSVSLAVLCVLCLSLYTSDRSLVILMPIAYFWYMTNTIINSPVVNATIDRAVVFVVLNLVLLLDSLGLFYCAINRDLYVCTWSSINLFFDIFLAIAPCGFNVSSLRVFDKQLTLL